MSRGPLSEDEQDRVVMDISAEGRVSPSDAEFDALYSQLDPDRQAEVDQSFKDFADDAVGHEHWDSDS